jgi:hypothetical protein
VVLTADSYRGTVCKSARRKDKFDTVGFGLKKQIDLEDKEQYQVKMSNSLELWKMRTPRRIWESITENVVLYGCETWSHKLREEHRLRVFENRVLRRIFGPKRDGVTGEWRRLHNEELNDLY